jgi:glycosyltransferase involved in cell wall biosynthesis
MSEAPFLSVVLPCRNQEDHIGAVLQRYIVPLERTGRSFELIAVPNACMDRTPEKVHEVAQREPRLRAIENPAGGWGRSVLAGLDAAHGHVLCYTNSARTDPEHVVQLLDIFLTSGPCIAKVRRVKRNAAGREIGSWLYNLEARVLFGLRSHDVNGTPKIFAAETYRQLAPTSPGDLLDLEVLARARRAGIPVVEMEVAGFSRHGGRSTTNLKSALRMYSGALALRATISQWPPMR